ncbi:MAG: hypothetical protein XXXJIFNMEKO3_03389 [Candidatus Erwinia impunctatus]|nr:hypothetical protein XXXJIFNMEKO_03389 [Culicoides impunctatus]
MKRFTLAALMAVLLSGCVTQPAPSKTAGKVCSRGDAMQQTTLYFGLSRAQGANITPAEWHAFLDGEVTPRFKEGLTVFDAQGQWLGENGKVVQEASKALMLIHGASAESDQAIETIRQHYTQRFQQESVMKVDSSACVAF